MRGGGHQEEGQCTPTAKTPSECIEGPLNVRLWPRSNHGQRISMEQVNP